MLEKVMQNGAKIAENDAGMVPKLVKNRSKIYAKIDSKIEAKFVVQKSIKNRPLERQRVAKVTSIVERRQVSGQDQLKVGPFDRNTLQGWSRHADGPKARRILQSISEFINLLID